MGSGWGGRRAGAGRKRRRLIDLVETGDFRWSNPRHRRLLVEDDSLLELPEGDLREALLAIQRFAWRDRMRTDAAHWARKFEEVVQEGPGAWDM
jgi:hypothetical protein